MDPVTLSAAIATVAQKLATDTAVNSAKAGGQSLWRRLQPDAREKAAKQAIELFTAEFVKELEDKSPLEAAIPGYRDQLARLLESAGADIADWFQPEIAHVELAPVARMWVGLGLDPLPEDFDWQFVAQNYAGAIRRKIKKDPELRQQFAIALQEDSHSFDQRFNPGFDLNGYREFLRKKCGMLQLSAIHATAYDRRLSLWGVFVPQSVRESEASRVVPREQLRQLRREGLLTRERDETQIAELRETYQSSPISPVLDFLRAKQSAVLLGDPGSGKTSLLKYLVLRWADHGEGHLPLWVDLREYAREPVGLIRYLESGTSFGLDARKVEERLQAADAVLYLDGLDEIFEAQARSKVIEQIAAFSARYPNVQTVVTSRIIGYEPERLRDAGFAHATLEDFDNNQVLEFLNKWHAVAEEDAKECTRLKTRLAQAITDSVAIRELAGNPLLLTMMAILNRNQELPRDRVELYREASRVLLHEWDAHRSLPVDTFARQEKEALLGELAGEMQQNEDGLAGNLIERGRLIAVFREFLNGLGISNPYDKAQSLVRQLTERNFILSYAGADRFSFVHRTFLEYFCAAWFVEKFEKQRTLSFEQLKCDVFGRHWQDETWHEVLRLIAGMVGEKQAAELIQFLMDQDGRSHKLANLMLAAGCLSEVRNRRAILPIDRSLRQRMVEEAISYDPPYYYEEWEEWDETGSTRVEAVSLLASVWRSQESREWLVSAAKTSRDWIVRRAAIQQLARESKDAPDMRLFLKECVQVDPDTDVCVAALQEVARGWKEDPDTLIFLKANTGADGDTGLRVAALQELARGWKDDPDTFPILRDWARADPEGAVRRAALQELARGWKKDAGILPLLNDRARTDTDPDVRWAAIRQLARNWKQEPDTVSWLKECARADTDNQIRWAAIHEITRGCKDDPETLPLIKERIRGDNDHDNRAAAIYELARGWKDDPDTLRWLKECAAADTDSSARRAALQQLARGWKDDPETLFLLKDRARADTDNDVRWAAVQELAHGWKDEPDTLLRLKERVRTDENYAVRWDALHELARGWREDPHTLALLKDRARADPDNHVRRAALRDLARGWKNDPDTLPLLKDRARTDTDFEVRWAVRNELTRGWKDDPEVIALLTEQQ